MYRNLIGLMKVGAPPGGGGGGITVVGAGSFQASGTAITPGLPTGTVENDVLIGFLQSAGSNPITLSDWAAPGDSPLDNGDWGIRGSMFWRRAGASEAAPTSTDSGTTNIGVILGFRGCVATGDPFEDTSSGFNLPGSTSIVIPGVTTTGANRMIVAACGFYRTATGGGNVSGGANANLDDFTERVDQSNNLGFGPGGFGIFTGTKATAGATGNTTATLASLGGHWYWSCALIPA